MVRLHEEGRQAILRRVQEIRDSVSELLKRNEEAEEIERLERSDFVIDTEQERKLLEETAKRTREVRAMVATCVDAALARTLALLTTCPRQLADPGST